MNFFIKIFDNNFFFKVDFFAQKIIMVGLGFKFEIFNEQFIKLFINFSHPLFLFFPKNIQIKSIKNQTLVLSSMDKGLLVQFSQVFFSN